MTPTYQQIKAVVEELAISLGSAVHLTLTDAKLAVEFRYDLNDAEYEEMLPICALVAGELRRKAMHEMWGEK